MSAGTGMDTPKTPQENIQEPNLEASQQLAVVVREIQEIDAKLRDLRDQREDLLGRGRGLVEDVEGIVQRFWHEQESGTNAPLTEKEAVKR